MKNERKTNHAFCCLPRAIFDFVLFSSQGPKSSTMRGLLALRWNVGPRWVHVFAAKNNIDFLLFLRLCRWDLQKKKKKKQMG